jgi:hypothetical protein
MIPRLNVTLAALCFAVILSIPPNASAQEQNGTDYTLRWSPAVDSEYEYSLSISGTHNGNVTVRTEDFVVRVVDESDGAFHFDATGEPVPPSARLGYRFQRALFPTFPYTVDELGNHMVPRGQPFPPFVNIPILPEEPVEVGGTWSGGPVGILPDPNVGFVPFTYESTLDSVVDYRGQMCAVIKTDYTVALQPDTVSSVPFLGLVEGDPPEEPGQGAPVGGIVEGSPAHEAGIQPGDFIIAAQGQRIRGWAGLMEILPFLVPDVEVEFTVKRGDEELRIKFAPEAVPVANVTAVGGLTSLCYFSLDEGIPLKVEVSDQDLVFTLSAEGMEPEVRPMNIRIVLDYQYEG